MYRNLIAVFFSFLFLSVKAQPAKILFDATKAETAGNADWVVDADVFNLGYGTGPAVVGGGNEANAQRIPTPAQSGISAGTAENYWKGGLSAWGVDCVKRGYDVETLPYNGVISYGNAGNPQDLANYKVFVVCEPNIRFTAAEKTALLNFVFNGGGLFMVSDHTASDRNNDGWDSPAIWNDLMTNNGSVNDPFGFSFDLATFSETSTNIPNLPADPLLHGPMGNVTSVQWSSGTSMTMAPAANSSVKAVAYKTGSTFNNNNVMCLYSLYGTGRIVAIGDSSPCDDGTGDTNDGLFNGYFTDAAGNHQRLLMNATIWLATTSIVVPLQFISCSGIAYPGNNHIIWTINEAAGSPTDYVIERSENGSQFYPIGNVEGNYNSNTETFYYDDNAVKASAEFYRVRMNRISTAPLFSRTVYLRSDPAVSMIVFPNPVSKNLLLKLPQVVNEAQLTVCDVQGRCVYTKTIQPGRTQLQIPVDRLQPGTYFVTLKDNSKSIGSVTFIKK